MVSSALLKEMASEFRNGYRVATKTTVIMTTMETMIT